MDKTVRWEERDQAKAGGEMKGGGLGKWDFSAFQFKIYPPRMLLFPGLWEKLGKSFMSFQVKDHKARDSND